MPKEPFTAAEVAQVRALWDSGKHTARSIAAMYGCAAETVARIGRRETWAWLPEGQGSAAPSSGEAAASLDRLLEELKDSTPQADSEPTSQGEGK